MADSKTGPGCGKVCVCAGAPYCSTHHPSPGAMDTLALGFWGPEALLPVFAEESPSEAAPGGQASGEGRGGVLEPTTEASLCNLRAAS